MFHPPKTFKIQPSIIRSSSMIQYEAMFQKYVPGSFLKSVAFLDITASSTALVLDAYISKVSNMITIISIFLTKIGFAFPGYTKLL
mmetsp:Transcript_19468/g.23677  ORF Transcript_19468/g.23677 Transcript_19468/m.23677 type:complete len:86 (-) Transcript_19468:313-570(-)